MRMSRIYRHSSGLSRFRAATRGISALEFAMVAPLLLTLMLLILESGLILFGQAALDTATADAARLIRTGQVQTASAGQTMFTTRLCNDMAHVVACGDLQVNVQSAGSFSSLDGAVATTASGAMANTGFAPGGPSQFVLVQVGYQPADSIPLVGAALKAAFGSLLVSSVAFQNEAY